MIVVDVIAPPLIMSPTLFLSLVTPCPLHLPGPILEFFFCKKKAAAAVPTAEACGADESRDEEALSTSACSLCILAIQQAVLAAPPTGVTRVYRSALDVSRCAVQR